MVVVSAPSNLERPEPTGDGNATGTLPAPGTEQRRWQRGAVAWLRDQRRGGSFGRGVPGVLGATSLVLVVVFGLVLLVPRPNAVPLQTVDVASAASEGVGVLGFSPAVPNGLTGWTATTAVVRRHGTDGIVTWHVGFRTPEGNYAGIEQAARSTWTWENALDSGAKPMGTVEVDGTRWDHLEKAERNTTALILRRPGRVTLITAKGGGLADAMTLVRNLPSDTLS
jgi:hypothetical protein